VSKVRAWLWVSAFPLLLTLSGCGVSELQDRRTEVQNGQDRYMATQPAINGENAVWLFFWAAVTTIAVIGAIVWSVARIRVASHESRARIEVARLNNGGV
jgi:heme/copper-type cytochrome/quinol oxidase subunit 2